jgi:hypothetical protein
VLSVLPKAAALRWFVATCKLKTLATSMFLLNNAEIKIGNPNQLCIAILHYYDFPDSFDGNLNK